MLSIPAPYPQAGAIAFLKPDGEECRILQQRADGRALITITGAKHGERFLPRAVQTGASGNRTVDARELAETKLDAVHGKAPRQSRIAKRPARGQGKLR